MDKSTVGVAMSGGVDSTAVALMLSKDYNVTGFFMQLAQPDLDDQIRKVTSIAEQIGIPLIIVDLQEKFSNTVLQYFSSSYFSGTTPNPCMICNATIKFGVFLNTILSYDMEKVATGHYSRLVQRGSLFHLMKGLDVHKDQSYFLARLSQQQLSKVLFPLGEMRKEDIYSYTELQGFSSFRGGESQDVCFLKETSVAEYLRSQQHSRPSTGNIVNKSGTILGTHSGIFNYTIGQRKGLGISAPEPLYVIAIDCTNNTVVVGSSKDLFCSSLVLENLHWVSGLPPQNETRLTAKIRYTHGGCPATVMLLPDNKATIQFHEPQRAVTPGQFCVLYDSDEVIGSGIITPGNIGGKS